MKMLSFLCVVFFASEASGLDFLKEASLPEGAERAGTGIRVSGAKAGFGEVEVKPATKYTLTLEVEFEGDAESIEENPRFEIYRRPNQTSPLLPSREIVFLDATGERVGQRVLHAIPFRERHLYEDVFYSPRNAVGAQITIAPGKGLRLSVHQLKWEETGDEGALNVNPVFASGYSGWRNVSAGGKLIEQGGQTIFDTKYGSTGASIPLPGPGTYALSAKATGNGYNSIVIARIHDADGKELMRASTRKYGPPVYFVPPKEAVSASLLVYSCLLEEVRLFRAGDESEIASLRAKAAG